MVAIWKKGTNPAAYDLATLILIPVVDCMLNKFAVRPLKGIIAANDV